MKDFAKYKLLADNKAYLAGARHLLERVCADGEVIKKFDLEDIVDKLKAWETDTFFVMDSHAKRSSK